MLPITAEAGPRGTSVRRLALLVTGIIAAESRALAQVAADLAALHLTRARWTERIARRPRRALTDAARAAQACHEPVLPRGIDWPAVPRGGRRVALIVDERGKAEEIHLFRASWADWGGSLPLGWAVWGQNRPLPDGYYRQAVDAILARIAALAPAGGAVAGVADRAHDIPAFADRGAATGWHWPARCTAGSGPRWRDYRGRAWAPRAPVERPLAAPGRRWKVRGPGFKAAGWRHASRVGVWAPGHAERLVALPDLPPRWAGPRRDGRRFWTEPGFRAAKARGWQREDSRVRGVAHHERLRLGMAWASLVTPCPGVQAARDRLAAPAERPLRARDGRPRPGQPRHARESRLTPGRRRVRQWLSHACAGAFPWRLADLETDSWTAQWQLRQAYRLILQTARP